MEEFVENAGRVTSTTFNISAVIDVFSKTIHKCPTPDIDLTPDSKKNDMLKLQFDGETSEKVLTASDDEVQCSSIDDPDLKLCCRAVEKSLIQLRDLRCTYDRSRAVPYRSK